MQHVMGIDIGEGEAVALAGVAVVGMDGVLQTAGLADDRQGAVAQGDQLRQAAGLECGGHQEQIGSSVDLMGQLVVHAEAGGELMRIAVGCLGEDAGQLRIAGAQQHDLCAGLHQLGQNCCDQIQALLAGQTADHADHRNVAVLLQAQLALQHDLILGLVLEVGREVVDPDVLVVAGSVIIVVNTVQDADQVVLAGAEQAVQALAVEVGLDLLSVGGRYGGDLVSVHQTALHAGSGAVELQLIGGVALHAQANQILHVAQTAYALILQVVNGVDGLDLRIYRQVAILNLQHRRDQAGLPVVAVQHVGHEVQHRHDVHDHAAEEGEALGLVVAVGAVYIITAEVVLAVDEVVGHVKQLHGLDAGVLMTVADIDVGVQYILHLVAPLLGNLLVQGQDDADVSAGLDDLLRESAGNVGQTARLDKRDALGSGKKNLHIGVSSFDSVRID